MAEQRHPVNEKGLDGAGEAGSAIAAFSIRRPVTVVMVFVSMIALGLISLAKIPLVLLPSLTFPGLFIWVPYNNATPEQIQETITKPLEEALATISGVERMQSFSSADSSQIGLFFSWDTDTAVKRAEIRERIDQVRNDLPDDVRQVFVRGFSTDDAPIIEAIISAKRDLRSAYDFLDVKIKKPLERLPGVGEVDLWGVSRQQLDVYLRLDDIKRYKVDVGGLFRRLDAANMNVSLGKVDAAGARHGAMALGAVRSVDEVADFPINDRGLRLRDVADVVFDEPVRNTGQHLNGEYAIGFTVRKASDANTVETVRRVKQTIEALRTDPELEGVEVHVFFDAGEEITRGLTGLLGAGSIGALLAVITLYLFLRRLGPSLAIGLSIPFSLIAAIGFVYLSGGTLNMLSMMGLMLSTGMLVDNAVVVLESIYQKLEKGLPAVEAARRGAGEVTTAVIAATLTTIIVFVPLVFGSSSQFAIWFGYAGLSIILALLCSLFISLTLIPLAMGRWLGKHDRQGLPKSAGAGRFIEGYLRAVRWPLRHRFITGFVLVPVLVGAAIYSLKHYVPDNTLEAQDQKRLVIQYEFSENFHYAKIERDYVGPVEEFIAANKERFKIDNYISRYGNNRAETSIYFDQRGIPVDELQTLRREIREGLPEIPGSKIRPAGGDDAGAQTGFISANLFGDSPETLTKMANEIRALLLENPNFDEVYTASDEAAEEVQIRLDRAKARKLGVTPESVSQVLGIVVRARQMRGFRTPEGEVETWVRLDPDDIRNVDDLRSIVVGAGADGQPIELRHVADFSMERTPPRIQRENRQTYTYLNAAWSGERKEDGRKAFSEVLDKYPFPEGYGWSYGFWTRRQDSDDKEALFSLLLSLFMVYFVMASLFESLSHPFSIMFSLPFATVGVVIMLLATNTPMNMMAVIGSLVLVGIVVNNGIVLIDHINNLRRSGLTREEAIVEGCRERFRPIVMTATTTVVGLLPLAFGDSGFFDLRYFPMARTIMGGLLASTLLTLIVLPTYYTLVDDFGRYLRRIWRESGAARSQPAEVSGD